MEKFFTRKKIDRFFDQIEIVFEKRSIHKNKASFWFVDMVFVEGLLDLLHNINFRVILNKIHIGFKDAEIRKHKKSKSR